MADLDSADLDSQESLSEEKESEDGESYKKQTKIDDSSSTEVFCFSHDLAGDLNRGVEECGKLLRAGFEPGNFLPEPWNEHVAVRFCEQEQVLMNSTKFRHQILRAGHQPLI